MYFYDKNFGCTVVESITLYIMGTFHFQVRAANSAGYGPWSEQIVLGRLYTLQAIKPEVNNIF